ncbi:G2/mitotic-specific cyclin-B-like [Anoplophora glabripennis]|uniref:G2/mitotic-specific cyclin-B-like n=1 Tax=Anoplophora glabripennis TaxID=217634 RepID=UPI00087498BB|nr:G2/mitotic-specific cyclin-B-like [Anoplophora glabripennis]
MALRHRTVENSLNQENMHAKVATKAVIPPRGTVPKRAALGDVKLSEANKLSNVNSNNNGVAKKGGVMGPPQALPKKTVTRKENALQEKSQNPNIIKPPIKRQESLLKNIHLERDKVTESSKSYSSKQISIIDPDENTKNDPQMVTEYITDIFNYLLELECKFPIKKHYLEGHQSSPKMRAILVNWLIEVHTNFKLFAETLFLCIAIIDRYLQENKNIGRATLQLVGTTAMIIASKYEETYWPDLDDYVYICDEIFSKRQIVQMERDILEKLDFNLGRPISLHFLRRYNKIAQVRSDHHALGKYLLELALLEYDMSHIRPSIQAAAACCLSIGILNEIMDLSKIWTPTLVHYTTYKYSDIKSTIVDLAHLIAKAETSKHQTCRNKYSTPAFAKISLSSKLHGPLIRKLTSTPLTKK